MRNNKFLLRPSPSTSMVRVWVHPVFFTTQKVKPSHSGCALSGTAAAFPHISTSSTHTTAMSSPFDLLPAELWGVVANKLLHMFPTKNDAHIAALCAMANTCRDFNTLIKECMWVNELTVDYREENADPFNASLDFAWFRHPDPGLIVAFNHLRGSHRLAVDCPGSEPSCMLGWLAKFSQRFGFSELIIDFGGNDFCNQSQFSGCIDFAPRLVGLSLDDTEITKDGLQNILENTSLRALSIKGCLELEKGTMAMIGSRAGPQLAKLEACDANYVSEFRDLNPTELPALEAVMICVSKYAHFGVEDVHCMDVVLHLASFPGVRKLRLCARGNESTGALVQVIARRFPRLESLCIDTVGDISRIQDVRPLGALEQLRKLELTHTCHLYLTNVADALCELKHFETLVLDDCRKPGAHDSQTNNSNLGYRETHVAYLLRKLRHLRFDTCSLPVPLAV